MIKRLFITFSFVVGFISVINACDACGCAASNFGMGLMTDYRSNFLRVGYFDARFVTNSVHGHASSSDVFSRMDISLRYSFQKMSRLRFIAQLPFGRNVRTTDGVHSTVYGLSDINLVANYVLVNKAIGVSKSPLYLEAGGGFKLPTGKYDAEILEKNLPKNFNIGNGSLGYILQANAVLSLNSIGFLWNNNYQWNAPTDNGYLFGNQLSSNFAVFKEFPLWSSKIKIIPNAGMLYESVQSDTYSNENRVPETGGMGLLVSSAINFKTDRWLAGTSYSLPMVQHYSSGIVDARGRLAVHFSYLF